MVIQYLNKLFHRLILMAQQQCQNKLETCERKLKYVAHCSRSHSLWYLRWRMEGVEAGIYESWAFDCWQHCRG
jgi:hypothetical protein